VEVVGVIGLASLADVAFDPVDGGVYAAARAVAGLAADVSDHC
jgi:hypothetical protein